MAFAYKGTLTVTSNSSLLPSTQTNFPVLVSLTDATLKTVGNGGKVQNASGYDIRFFSDTDLSSAIAFELESYDGSAGTIVCWVLQSSLSLGLVFYMGFGDAALNTNASSTSTWDSNYAAVYHFGAISGFLIDSTSNGFNLTNNGSIISGVGRIGDGTATLNGTTQYLSNASLAVNNVPSRVAITISYWENLATANVGGGALGVQIGTTTDIQVISPFSDKTLYWDYSAPGRMTANYTAYLDKWSHVVVSANGFSDHAITLDGTRTPATNGNNPTVLSTGITIAHGTSFGYLKAGIDEVRVSIGIARAADWITAEYNNQNDPTTFIGAVFVATQSVVPPIMNSYRQQRAA